MTIPMLLPAALPIACVLLALLGAVAVALLQRRRDREPAAGPQRGLVLASSLRRADVLSAVRHELRLPVGADRARRGEMYLLKATDSLVVVAANDRRRPVFVAALTAADTAAGCVSEYRIEQPHRVGEYDSAVRDVIVHAVRSVDPHVRIDPTEPRAA